jgi:hypothetical protein
VVSVWVALAAWLIAWIVLAWLSMSLLKQVRPGERVPMRRLANGTPTWRVQPGFAALFTPALATVVGLFTIGVSLVYGHGQAPIMNVLLAVVFVAAHWMHVTMAVKVLESERGGK